MKLPIVFALDRAGLVGADGPTHHGAFDISFVRMIPHFTFAAPRDENELRHLLHTALRSDGPFAIRFQRGSGIGVPIDSPFRKIRPGTGEILKHGGKAVMLAIGRMVHPALEAAERLEQEGIDVEVVDLRYIKPLDEKLILSEVSSTGRVITLEDNVLAGGIGSAVCELLADKQMTGVPVLRIGLPDRDVEHGDVKLLDKKHGLDTNSIYRRAKRFISSTKRMAIATRSDDSRKLKIVKK
jgi:1-deoxy-D-xylulose-5-phosphate synthase